ncbi:MAG TPA: hypothetical protein VHN14_35000, partial [Kofleriaceae bacterium]|nr:hypothetical protein [Kofleriaceae bacterium]
ENIKTKAPELEAFIMGRQFEGCDGYKTVIGQIQIPDEARGAVSVLQEAARLQAMGMTVKFEITSAGNAGAPKYDIDLAAIAPGTQVIHCYAVKRVGLNKLTQRLGEAARQLANYVPPSGWTVVRVVAIHVNDGSDDDYRTQKMQGTKDVITNNTQIDEFRIVLASGTIVQAPGDL